MACDHGDTDGRGHTVGLYTVSFGPLGDRVVCRGDETVLSAILRSGAKVMFGCRGGGCGTCKMRLISGRVEYGRCSTAVLPEEAKREGAFLSCQARPLSDLTVELTRANRYRRPSDAYWRVPLNGPARRQPTLGAHTESGETP